MPKIFSRYAQDIFLILRSQLALIIFIAAPMFLFLYTDQGQDVALCVVEDLADGLPATTFCLLSGLIFWSISSRFCSRMLTYISDNSGHALAPAAVARRVRLQKRIANVIGLTPVVIAFLSFLRVGLRAVFGYHYFLNVRPSGLIFCTVSIMFLILVIGTGMQLMFCSGGLAKLSCYKTFSWLQFPDEERNWADRLYGIFNDIRFEMTKATAKANDIDLNKPLPTGKKLPNGNTLPPATDERPAFTICDDYPATDTKSGLRVWMYQAPVRYYKVLHLHFCILLAIAGFIIIFYSCCPFRDVYAWTGSVALVFLACGSWQLIYTLAHYADKVKYRWRFAVPVRTVLFALFIVTTCGNHDHPVHRTTETLLPDSRPSLAKHFISWYAHLNAQPDVYREPDKSLPVIFITAEGGALRTGGFTTMLLARMADSFHEAGFNRYIYGYSSVSGGSIGCNIYYALTRLSAANPDLKSTMSSLAEKFYSKDYLAPAVGKFFFGEIINYYLPFHVRLFDRAIALEGGWEDGFGALTPAQPGAVNYLAAPYFITAPDTGIYPALFTNTVEAETGRQCIWSNVNISALPKGRLRDLFGRYRFNLPFSAATNLSSRFPLISPAAAFYPAKKDARASRGISHYVDGGYYENKGSETMLQVLQALKRDIPDTIMSRIHPYVIQINFGTDEDSSTTPIRKFNDITEIVGAIAHTRGARGELEQDYLQYETGRLGGTFIKVHIAPSGDVIPNDWVLSERASKNIRTITDSIVRNDAHYTRHLKDNWGDLFMYKKAKANHF